MTSILNELQDDMLKELINLSMGDANTEIATILDTFGTMHIPHIAIVSPLELQESMLKDKNKDIKHYVSKQKFSGEFEGECILVIDENSASNLEKYFHGSSTSNQNDIYDAIVEFSNIVTVAILKKLTFELNTDIHFAVPTSTLSETSKIINFETLDTKTQIIVMESYLEFKVENISASIYILTKNDSILKLRNLIDKKISLIYS